MKKFLFAIMSLVVPWVMMVLTAWDFADGEYPQTIICVAMGLAVSVVFTGNVMRKMHCCYLGEKGFLVLLGNAFIAIYHVMLTWGICAWQFPEFIYQVEALYNPHWFSAIIYFCVLASLGCLISNERLKPEQSSLRNLLYFILVFLLTIMVMCANEIYYICEDEPLDGWQIFVIIAVALSGYFMLIGKKLQC